MPPQHNPTFYQPNQQQVDAFLQPRGQMRQSFQPVVHSPTPRAAVPQAVRSPGGVGSPTRVMGSPGGGMPMGWAASAEQMLQISAVQCQHLLGVIKGLETKLAATGQAEKGYGRDAAFPPAASSSGHK